MIRAYLLAALVAVLTFVRAHWPAIVAALLFAASIATAHGVARYLDTAAVVAVGLLGFHLGHNTR